MQSVWWVSRTFKCVTWCNYYSFCLSEPLQEATSNSVTSDSGFWGKCQLSENKSRRKQQFVSNHLEPCWGVWHRLHLATVVTGTASAHHVWEIIASHWGCPLPCAGGNAQRLQAFPPYTGLWLITAAETVFNSLKTCIAYTELKQDLIR